MSEPQIKSPLVFRAEKPEVKTDDSSGVVIFLKDDSEKSLISWSSAWKRIKKTGYEMRCSLIKFYSGVVQFFSWFLFWPLYNMCFNLEIKGRENLRNLRGPLIMISNHSRFYDSFLYRLIVGLFSPIQPMRFMAVLKFSDPFLSFIKKTGIIHLIYSLFGVFVIEHGLGLNKNLKRARDILKNNGVVAMFPEGFMNRSHHVAMFKRGVSALALSTHTRVLPMSIIVEKGDLWRLRRAKIKVHIGTAHFLQTGRTYEELAEELRQEVIELGK